MTYLELCQRLRQEVGASGSDSTVVGAANEWGRLCTWINRAWSDIQLMRNDWNWMRAEVSFNTVAEQAEYAYASSPISLTHFRRWNKDSFRIYLDSVGDEHRLQYMPYREFRNEYLISTFQTTYSYPSVITVSPTDSLILALPPDNEYTVTGEYYNTVTELSADDDTPSLPAEYHMLIVYRAMEEYGYYEAADEVLSRSKMRYEEMMTRLLDDETPDIIVDRGFC